MFDARKANIIDFDVSYRYSPVILLTCVDVRSLTEVVFTNVVIEV